MNSLPMQGTFLESSAFGGSVLEDSSVPSITYIFA
jgi:hypothetical protein